MIHKITGGLLFSLLLGITACSVSEKNTSLEELSQYVEPRIGTAHCRWFHFYSRSYAFWYG